VLETKALFDVTERAAQRAKKLLAEKGQGAEALRVKVTAGGCSGFSYSLEPWADAAPQSDLRVQTQGLTIFIDKKSVLFLAGTRLDYEDTVFSQKFVFKNPQATSTCSCGESFAV
jgi:iron-sulfur cluster assembly accessory protein